jgi:hypothetical protein
LKLIAHLRLIFSFQTLNFLVETFGLLSNLFPFLPILDASYPVFDLHLADVLFDVILPSVLGSYLTFKNRASYIQDGRTATLQM